MGGFGLLFPWNEDNLLNLAIDIWHLEKIDATTYPLVDDFVKRCITWLRSHNSSEKEGIFRKAGAERRLLELQAEVGEGEYSFPADEDDHVIATLLKRFFRDMKAPLLTFDLYDTLLGADSFEGEERLHNIQHALILLPEFNMRVLETVVRYLNEVSSYSSVNFMTANNIAIVFAPNLLRPRNETPLTLISDAGHVTGLVGSLIADCNVYFPKVAVAKPAINKEDFKQTMTVKYIAHQTLTQSLVAQMAKEAHLSDEEMQQKLKIIGNRIKKGDKKAMGLLFSDSASERDHSPSVSPNISPNSSPRKFIEDSSNGEPLSPRSWKRVTAEETGGGKRNTPDAGAIKLRPVAHGPRIPKSLDLFGGTPLTHPAPLTHAASAGEASYHAPPPVRSSTTTSSSQTSSFSNSSPNNVSSTKRTTPSEHEVPPISISGPISPIEINGPYSHAPMSPPSRPGHPISRAQRSKELRRAAQADLNNFLKQIIQDDDLVEAAAAAETKEAEIEKVAAAEVAAKMEEDEASEEHD